MRHFNPADLGLGGQDGQHLVFTVTDDGTGFNPATTPMGTGLQGIADRLAALDGTVGITSAAGHGTQIIGAEREFCAQPPSPSRMTN
jgi:signal transduction histidine kinase